MNMEYTLRIEKIEALLDRELPPLPEAGARIPAEGAGKSWIDRTFPGLELRPEQLRPLLTPGRDLLDRGGKRWRPLLSLLVCETLGGGDAALPLLPLVEFPHNASLVHDDIEDNSDERRGKPALHLIYGTDTAINSGSFLYFLPLSCIETWDAPAEAKNRIWSLWGEHMRRLHLGQSMDIAWHRDFSVLPPVEDYELMCRLKTGCLARFAALLGAAAASSGPGGVSGDSPEGRERVSALGGGAEKLGVGFQILDDVRNLSSGIPGKKRGDDVVEGKKSLPVLLFLHAHGDKIPFAEACFSAARKGGAEAPEVEALIAALTESGALEKAEKRGLELIREAGEIFNRAVSGSGLVEEARGLLAGLPALLG
ncbi:MAG: polyprenyl synthetase family protein [Treponema sp.]|jgi:octaprenyl-diphosphate synthase|nr:polyprenyl synthetase family protein [Treponema sp.]